MKTFVMTVSLFGLAANVHAHVADVAPMQHATEHSWLLLALLALLALLLPLVRRPR